MAPAGGITRNVSVVLYILCRFTFRIYAWACWGDGLAGKESEFDP